MAVVAARQKTGDGLGLFFGKLTFRNFKQIGVQRLVHAHNGGIKLVYAVGGNAFVAAEARKRARNTFRSKVCEFGIYDSRSLNCKAWSYKQVLVKGGNIAVDLGAVAWHGKHAKLFKQLCKGNEHKGHYHVEQGVKIRYAAFVNGFAPKGKNAGAFKHKHAGGEKHRSDDVEIKVRKRRALCGF